MTSIPVLARSCVVLVLICRFKAECMIDGSPETCFRHCNPKPEGTRATWDSSIKDMEVIQRITKDQWPVY